MAFMRQWHPVHPNLTRKLLGEAQHKLCDPGMSDDLPLPVFPLDIFQLLVDEIGFRLRSREERIKWQDTNFQSLLSLSLVCKTLTAMCRPHLFREIKVTVHESEISGSKVHKPTLHLAKLIALQPSIGHSIQSIEVAYPVEWMYKNMHRAPIENRVNVELDSELEARSLAPTLDEASLLTFLNLPNIRVLDIFPQTFGGYTHLYPTLSANLMGPRSMLNHYLYNGILSVLSLSYIDALPIVSILSSPTLESLNLCNCRIYATSDIEASLSSGQHPPFRLRKLMVTSGSGLTLPIVAHCRELEHLALCATTIKAPSLPLDKWPTSNVFRRLRHLETSSSSVDLAIVFTMAKDRHCLAFPSLESLQLLNPVEILSSLGPRILESTCILKSLSLANASHSSRVRESELDLYQCLKNYPTSLETLEINWTTSYLTDPFITLLCNALEDISYGPNALQTLTIQQTTFMLTDTDDQVGEAAERLAATKEGWRRLSRILTRGRLLQQHRPSDPGLAPEDGAAFPDLKSVTLKVVASKLRHLQFTDHTLLHRRVATSVQDELNLWQGGELNRLQKCPEITLKYHSKRRD